MCLRNMRTTQERRANQCGPWINKDHGVVIPIKIRPGRVKLINAWDDIIRGDYNCRSWKRHRKTQYHRIKNA